MPRAGAPRPRTRAVADPAAPEPGHRSSEVPNPAGPGGRPAPSASGEGRATAGPGWATRRLTRLADALPDELGSIRFRLTAIYSLVLFGLAALMVAGVYLLVASRLHQEEVYGTVRANRVEEVPGGFQLTPLEIRTEYRSIEELANERALSVLRTYSTTALVLLFLASLGVGWIIAGRVLAPIGRITSVARDIQATDLSRRIALRGPPDELRELADTFDAMLARLDDAFEGQRRFIQETSHELRNPLAVIRTNLDVALADPDADPDDLRRTAELVGRSAARMTRLVDDLLVYARSGAPGRHLGPVDLAVLATDSVEEFEAPALVRGLDLRAAVQPLPPGSLEVLGDRIALRRAIANLLSNAARLAPSGTTVAVAVGRDPGDDTVWVSVADEGPGIDEADRGRVFERFWRGDQAAAREEGRSGLGLAIVDQIVADHGGTVALDANAAGGSTFTLRLPAAPAL